MTTFSFRAECYKDVEDFLKVLFLREFHGCSAVSDLHIKFDQCFPDVEVEIQTFHPVEKEAILQYMRELEDTHVMRQSLRLCPLSENSLERDRNVL